MSEQGARRYPRTFHGLIVSMVVLVIVVVVYWALNNVTHDTPNEGGSAVDYRSAVHDVQAAGAPLKVVYPTSLPQGWKATSADYAPPSGPGTGPTWGLGVVTDHDSFVGLRLEATPLTALVATYIDKNASSDGQKTLHTALGDAWSTFSDAGGDTGYAMQLGDDVLLVYGSADKADFTTFMQSLTQAELPGVSSPASPAGSVSPLG
ncbi:DUF4245 family protein [Nocardioides sp. BP30]|uniref:DUF4245 family protein n=1 Tax=Nocardioides sp. BP30 TaxID=3036374 RepID=UPI002469AD06|nr:DUF4245 family protein [Nocardioides sp. BP30]WGL53409.1 DUF4245 family protein [Nocardioides sp. BP30]